MQTQNPLELLAAAVRSGDVASLREALLKHPDLKPRLNEELPGASFGSTALLEAVNHKNRDVIDALLDAGADPNARSHWWAGSFGVLDTADPDLSAHMIERGAKLDAHSAARLGKLDELKKLIAYDPSLVHARGGDGQTPLHFAATIDIARFLLENGADFNTLDIDHESTPAQWMMQGRHEVARYLVERGCNTDLLMAAALGNLPLVRKHLEENPASIRMIVSDKWFPRKDPRAASTIYVWTLGINRSPHRIARDFKHENVYQYLMQNSPLEVQLVAACSAGDEPGVHEILATNPHAARTLTDADAEHIPAAAHANDANIVRLMIEAGFPISARGIAGGTALHWGAWHGNVQIVKHLLAAHADLENADNDFHSKPIGWALHGSANSWHRQTGDHPAVVELLLKAGAKPPEITATTEASEAVRAVLARHLQKPPALPPQPDHSMFEEQPTGEDETPSDIHNPRSKRHPRKEGRGGTP